MSFEDAGSKVTCKGNKVAQVVLFFILILDEFFYGYMPCKLVHKAPAFDLNLAVAIAF